MVLGLIVPKVLIARDHSWTSNTVEKTTRQIASESSCHSLCAQAIFDASVCGRPNKSHQSWPIAPLLGLARADRPKGANYVVVLQLFVSKVCGGARADRVQGTSSAIVFELIVPRVRDLRRYPG